MENFISQLVLMLTKFSKDFPMNKFVVTRYMKRLNVEWEEGALPLPTLKFWVQEGGPYRRGQGERRKTSALKSVQCSAACFHCSRANYRPSWQLVAKALASPLAYELPLFSSSHTLLQISFYNTALNHTVDIPAHCRTGLLVQPPSG